MDKDEMKNRISLALKDPILQQGFEIICKDLAISEHDREHNDYELTEVYKKVEQLEKENAELKERLLKIENAYKKKFDDEWRLNDLYQHLLTDFANAEKCSREYFTQYIDMKKLFIKAKDLIENIIRVTWNSGWNYSLDWKVKAEQYLKDLEK